MALSIWLCLSSSVGYALGSTLYVASFAPYPGYSGDLHVKGTATIADGGATAIATQKLTWSLSGLDTACTVGAADNVKNGCGIHVHTGTSCEAADAVGGHYYSQALSTDPWASVRYVAAADGSSQETSGVGVVTGLSTGDLLGRVVVVHELASGARVACGRLGMEMPPPQLEEPDAQSTCAGYEAPQANTDTSGDLLAKIRAGDSAKCCSLCDARADCEGYVFHLDQCYLKKNLEGFIYKEHAVTRLKSKSNCAGYTPEMTDVDISGTDLAKIQAPNLERCCALCDGWPGCEGYVFHLDQCYLKKDLGTPLKKPGAVTRMKFRTSQMPSSSASLRGMGGGCGSCWGR